jgi:hypothetical protein
MKVNLEIVAGGIVGGGMILAGSAHADFVEYRFDSYTVSVAGTTYGVIDVHAVFDNADDTVLNLFNGQIATSSGVEFHHNDFNTLSGSPGAWNVTGTADLPGLGIVPDNDSFVLIGGPVPGTGNTTALDPSFDPGTGGGVASDAGWFNSNPPNLQGRVDPSTLETFVARFVIDGLQTGEVLSFAANLGYNQGLGTPAQFAYPDPLGSGTVYEVAFVCADGDGDGVDDCNDNCPGIANAGQADADGDGVGDACDGCPDDPAKTDPGTCGCGVADTDGDGDGTPDCIDGCPNDPNKVDPGVCGCGVAETDGDSDGTPDCIDGCPTDPAKTEPGACGCGTPDTDSDGDGTPDCNDGCPEDPNKLQPGVCGCGTPDSEARLWYPDADGDGYGDASAGGTVSCVPIDGFVDDATDCDDGDAGVNPGAEEECGNDVDENCDGSLDDCDSPVSIVGVFGDVEEFFFEGQRYVGIDVFIEFDPTSVELVNVYDATILNVGGRAFVQNDFADGSWSPLFTDPQASAVDSFVTIGGEPGPAAGNTTALDPAFDGGGQAVPPVGAGWYNSNPANLQGLSDPATGRVLLGRFVVRQTLEVETLSFTGRVSFAEYPDGPTQQETTSATIEYPAVLCPSDLDGDGVVDGSDLGRMLLDWGSDDPVSDIDGNGIVDGGDLGVMLLDWGGCL